MSGRKRSLHEKGDRQGLSTNLIDAELLLPTWHESAQATGYASTTSGTPDGCDVGEKVTDQTCQASYRSAWSRRSHPYPYPRTASFDSEKLVLRRRVGHDHRRSIGNCEALSDDRRLDRDAGLVGHDEDTSGLEHHHLVTDLQELPGLAKWRRRCHGQGHA